MTPSRQYRPRVVLVDDHPSVLRAVSRLLESDCDVVARADNGLQAIDAVVMLKPDVMVVDLMMREMDGLEVCRRVKEVAPETDVIISSALDDAHIEQSALEAGASALVAKFAASGALMSTIRRLTDKKQSGR